ncbi:ABC transporter ATP-binding protein [Vallitalea pronyensis]|uniref:ABC transporter ATP-binding protein n=1 Tax=Vallitalea pronyensis TaxID=1348613 RepID=A0A8J8SHX2_9FIRM|nr:ABC transporter ATP-binding protein [Vallitalea pronyensis]
MLNLRGVTKKFGGLTAVDDVGFHIKQGSIVGLIGPNGSGKTTLFNLVSGVYPLTAGWIEFNGIDITKMKSHAIAKLGLVRTFQIVKPFNNITALENVVVGAFQKYSNRVDAEKKAIQSMKMLGLLKYKDIQPQHLPLAIKKKLEIARIISTEPEIVLLDEVMGGLNPQETEEIVETIIKINQTGITVLLIEHKMKCIMKLSEDVVVLNNGAMIAHGEPEAVVNDTEVIRAYLGDDYHVEN